jgi:hypothetical protein
VIKKKRDNLYVSELYRMDAQKTNQLPLAPSC